MALRNDPNYLRDDQYRDSSQLQARIRLHQHYSTNKYDWFLWVFDHFALPPHAKILELGCGSAMLWRKNLHRIPAGWDITISDFSQGMLEDAWQLLAREHQAFHFSIIDAMDIPFPTGQLDAVIANHMLYHVPDREKAFDQISRVLKPGGRLYAATNGEAHLVELDELITRFAPGIAQSIDNTFTRSEFTLENGASQLSRWFNSVTCHDYPDGLVVTDPQPLIEYILSLASSRLFDAEVELMDRLDHEVRQTIHENGAVTISKATGLFIAVK